MKLESFRTLDYRNKTSADYLLVQVRNNDYGWSGFVGVISTQREDYRGIFVLSSVRIIWHKKRYKVLALRIKYLTGSPVFFFFVNFLKRLS